MPEETKRLRDKARHCERLAMSVTDPSTRAILTQMSSDLQATANARQTAVQQDVAPDMTEEQDANLEAKRST